MKVCEKKSKTSSSYYIVLPREILAMAKVKKGDELIISCNRKKEIVIKKVGA